MKTKSIKLLQIAFILFGMVIIQSCKKSGNSDSFTWTWNGNNFTGNYKEAFIQSLGSGSSIISGTGPAANTAGTGPRISVTSLNVGTYNLSGGLPNYIHFIDPAGDALSSTTGTLTITSYSNSKLSGSFSATLINSTNQNTSLTGSFSNIIVSP